MVGVVEVGALFSLDGVEVHLDCWCICLCCLHFAPENPEDGKMYLLVLAQVVVVVVVVAVVVVAVVVVAVVVVAVAVAVAVVVE